MDRNSSKGFCVVQAILKQDLQAVIKALDIWNDIDYVDIYNDDMTFLMYAAMVGNLEIVKVLLQRDIDVTCTDQYGQNALHYAARVGNAPCVQALLQAGVSPYNAGMCGTPLAVAVSSDSQDTVKLLVHYRREEETAGLLERSLLSPSTSVLKMLLDAGCNPNARDESFLTYPLHAAANRDNVEAILELIQAGAILDVTDNSGLTPLFIATRIGHVHAVSALLKHGADPNIFDKSYSKMHVCHYAAQLAHMKCLQELLKHRAMIDPRDRDGMTPLMRAITCGPQDPCTSHLLIKEACDLQATAQLASFNAAKRTAERSVLELAIRAKKLDLARVLISAGCTIKPDINRELSMLDIHQTEAMKDFWEWVKVTEMNPRPLKHQCRLVIRNSLRPGPISLKLSKLQLPSSLNNYILLCDLLSTSTNTKSGGEIGTENTSELAYYMPAKWINHDEAMYAP